tara:strand:+ start:65 stop:493 length:429 start_codon:yes stop_codon:yes gene_type:complete
MSEWCQNKKCPQKKNQNQMRGSKGAKYYQSNKASQYYEHWCSMGCREEWWKEHADTCMNAVGFIDKQVLLLSDAWYVEFSYSWRNQSNQDQYYLINKLKGVKQVITKQQAQTKEQQAREYGANQTIDTTQAKELAITLGLAS